VRGEELAGEKERGEENKEENLLTFLPENQGAFSYNAYSRNCSFQYSVGHNRNGSCIDKHSICKPVI